MREGTSLTLGGGGRVLVDAAELTSSARVLRDAAAGLDHGDLRLLAASGHATTLAVTVPEAGALADALDRLRAALHGPAALARDVRDLAARTTDAAAVYGLAETDAQARWGVVVGLLGQVAGAVPSGPALLAGAAVAAATGDLLLAEARALGVAPWRALSPWGARDSVDRLVRTPQRIVTDGRAGPVLQLLGAALASASGARAPHLDPVRRFAAHVAGLLPARDVRLVPRVDPPDLPAPRTLEDLVGAVARTYDDDTPTGDPGTPVATVTVQRLDHPDSTRTWVVAVPGTRAAGLTGDVPTDNGTNLALEGGVPDVMTRAVLDAMAAAGVGADEPVAIVGHSQGGMVATSVAAAGTYAVRLVVTAGSPDVPAVPPTGVATVTIRHRQDAVSLLDGRVGERGGPGTLSVVRDLTATGGPAAPSFSEAHAVGGYVGTAALVDDALADLPADDPVRRALGEVLGADAAAGTGAALRATTLQYTVTAAPPDPVQDRSALTPAPVTVRPALAPPVAVVPAGTPAPFAVPAPFEATPPSTSPASPVQLGPPAPAGPMATRPVP